MAALKHSQQILHRFPFIYEKNMFILGTFTWPTISDPRSSNWFKQWSFRWSKLMAPFIVF